MPLVKAAKCRRKSVDKACHTPCFQNGLEKSALEILRISFSPAFSHKELMTLFWADPDFLVKMTKCRRSAHRCARLDPGARVTVPAAFRRGLLEESQGSPPGAG